VALAAAGISLAACGGDDDSSAGPSFDQDRAFADLRAQVRFGSRPASSAANRRQVEFLAERLRSAGAEDVQVQAPHRNVVGTVPGREPGVVVLGAHHDTKDAIPGFVGANDGASGVAAVLEIARSLPRPAPGPSVAIALFDAEEARGQHEFERDGARGSRQYVRDARDGGRQGSPPLDEIRAMILLDLVGDCDLQIPYEPNSDRRLYEQLEGGPIRGRTGPIGDDHIPFRDAGVPAVDLIDFTFGPGPAPGAYWHTPKDTLDKVCPESLGAVGRAVLGVLPQIR
jgi:Zn-dependent M28 family amino/carboxypeptidase